MNSCRLVSASFMINSVSVLSQLPANLVPAAVLFQTSKRAQKKTRCAAHAWNMSPNQGLAGAQGITEGTGWLWLEITVMLGQEKDFW